MRRLRRTAEPGFIHGFDSCRVEAEHLVPGRVTNTIGVEAIAQLEDCTGGGTASDGMWIPKSDPSVSLYCEQEDLDDTITAIVPEPATVRAKGRPAAPRRGLLQGSERPAANGGESACEGVDAEDVDPSGGLGQYDQLAHPILVEVE